MAGGKTAYLSQLILDQVLGGVTYTPPATIYFALSSSPFDPNATGASCAELTAGDYFRLSATNDLTTWTYATNAAPSLKRNLFDISWSAATTDWGVPASVYVADALTAGNLLYGADLATADDVAIGDVASILAETFVFSED